jgi:hypothetical protein
MFIKRKIGKKINKRKNPDPQNKNKREALIRETLRDWNKTIDYNTAFNNNLLNLIRDNQIDSSELIKINDKLIQYNNHIEFILEIIAIKLSRMNK